jgi:hypothetical protein
MLTRSSLSIFIITACTALAMPGAYAGPDPDEFSTQVKRSDAGAKSFAEFPKTPKVAVKAKQTSNPRHAGTGGKAGENKSPAFADSQPGAPQASSPQGRNYQEWADDWGH